MVFADSSASGEDEHQCVSSVAIGGVSQSEHQDENLVVWKLEEIVAESLERVAQLL